MGQSLTREDSLEKLPTFTTRTQSQTTPGQSHSLLPLHTTTSLYSNNAVCSSAFQSTLSLNETELRNLLKQRLSVSNAPQRRPSVNTMHHESADITRRYSQPQQRLTPLWSDTIQECQPFGKESEAVYDSDMLTSPTAEMPARPLFKPAKSNSCLSLTTQYTDLSQTLKSVAYLLCGMIQSHSIDHAKDSPEILLESLHPLSNNPLNTSSLTPATLHTFLMHIFTLSNLPSEFSIISLIYVTRLTTPSPSHRYITLTYDNYLRLFLSGLILSSKIYIDELIYMSDFLPCFPDRDPKELVVDLVNLERWFFKAIRYGLVVKVEEFEAVVNKVDAMNSLLSTRNDMQVRSDPKRINEDMRDMERSLQSSSVDHNIVNSVGKCTPQMRTPKPGTSVSGDVLYTSKPT